MPRLRVSHREDPTERKDRPERLSRIGLQQRTSVCRNEVGSLALILEQLKHRQQGSALGPFQHWLVLVTARIENVLVGRLPGIDVTPKSG